MIKVNVNEKVRGFISRFVKMDDCNDDTNIFESGMVNSLFSMQLIMFLENEFSIQIENDELDLSNFETINKICAFVERKTV